MGEEFPKFGLEETGENATEDQETIEKESEPIISIYLLRHGETGKDKTDPKRTLTENGVHQVEAATERIVDQLISDAHPDSEVDDETKKEILESIHFRLYDSGTTRTQEQISLERAKLLEMEVPEENIYLPQSYYDYVGEKRSSGPGIPKRLEGVIGMDESPGFREKIADPEYQRAVGASDEITSWALTPEEELPPGVESFQNVKSRVAASIEKLENVIPYLARKNERIVIIANSHASNVTIASANILGIRDLRELGQAGNVEGVKMTFSKDGSRKVEPFGENYESKVGRNR